MESASAVRSGHGLGGCGHLFEKVANRNVCLWRLCRILTKGARPRPSTPSTSARPVPRLRRGWKPAARCGAASAITGHEGRREHHRGVATADRSPHAIRTGTPISRAISHPATLTTKQIVFSSRSSRTRPLRSGGGPRWWTRGSQALRGVVEPGTANATVEGRLKVLSRTVISLPSGAVLARQAGPRARPEAMRRPSLGIPPRPSARPTLPDGTLDPWISTPPSPRD
jgi:hypothetical protein